ncbi:uncharacterized protein LOC107607301 [Arachis ipaensis]|uniref:uncharacterized protein LOC107607301 n=1 Tax=Arachis ipaensis TaxID=130454 RepID=UPI0007AF4B8B|nr:uncharacterized protein LOC107607301 [Arachis ipaensis]
MAIRGQGRSYIRRDYEVNLSMDNHAELVAAMTNLSNTIQAGTAMATHALRWIRPSVKNKNVKGVEDSLGGVLRTLVAFLKVDLSAFNGSTNPTEADNWFKVVEGALQTQQVPNNQFVEYAAYQLVGEAQHWWQRECRFLQLQNMNILCELFRTAFYKKYFHESVREARELELMQLKQGSMSVAEYTSKFEELCRFSRVCRGAPESYEGWKCKRYKGGLSENIMNAVTPLEIRIFSELVDKATIVEDYAKEAALMRDEHGGTSSRGRGKYVLSRGQNFKNGRHAPQQSQV